MNTFRPARASRIISGALVLAAVAAIRPAVAEVKLPAVIDNHMVLQRDVPLPIWGYAAAGEKVSVTFRGTTKQTRAGADGRWRVTLPPAEADGKPHQMTIVGTNQIVLTDILVGEVWLGSGQSNMEWSVGQSFAGRTAIGDAGNHPAIRLLHVRKVKAGEPARDINPVRRWSASSSSSVPGFSAALYYFGRRIQAELRVPVGLINSSWGGSPIEPWTVKNGRGGGMYNAMIAPLAPFPLRGALWYQGESNVNNGFGYFGRMRDLIEGWRGHWGPGMSFYFVQIAPWARYRPGMLPQLWEAQVATLKMPKTGMIVTTDIVHNIGDIHPKNKTDVGERLARWALVGDYGRQDVIFSGPLYKSMKVERGKIRLTFAHAGKGLKSRDGKPLTEFKIAGADGNFAPAEAAVDGDTVVVHSADVPSPKAVRFGWHKTANPNLVNSAGLPASPFHTDGWRGGTAEDFAPPPPKPKAVEKSESSAEKSAREKGAKQERMAQRLLQTAKQAERMGQRAAAAGLYEKLIKDYPETASAKSARERLAKLRK
ncbi:MAG: sialate O-acetylesterase [Planctomycetota bacterium]|jgi:sialate O-acetylesterase